MDKEKFLKWAYAVPFNEEPIISLDAFRIAALFEITELLTPKSAYAIYDKVNEKLHSSAYTCQGHLTGRNVVFLCTTEDPTDSWE